MTPSQKQDIEAVLAQGSVGDLVEKVYFETKEEAFEHYKEADNERSPVSSRPIRCSRVSGSS